MIVAYAPEADRDVERHHEWLLAYSIRAAEVFMAQIARAEARILARPHACRVLNDGETRRFAIHMRTTTYLMDYQIEQTRIVILRVWHGRQDRPG